MAGLRTPSQVMYSVKSALYTVDSGRMLRSIVVYWLFDRAAAVRLPVTVRSTGALQLVQGTGMHPRITLNVAES